MSQAYNAPFVHLYDRRWTAFARQLAPVVRDYYERAAPQGPRSLLDLGCGTGVFAYDFLQAGYDVTGLDLSLPMLAHARQRCADAPAGRASFFAADLTRFALARRYGLVAATYDVINHLPDMQALRAAFGAVRRVLAPGGLFLFDLNTRAGLRERWPSLHVEDETAFFLLVRGLYDEEQSRGYTSITGFVRGEDGRFDRVSQVAYNTAFELAAVRSALQDAGWPAPYAAAPSALSTPLDDPEAATRVVFVAWNDAAAA